MKHGVYALPERPMNGLLIDNTLLIDLATRCKKLLRIVVYVITYTTCSIIFYNAL